MNFEIQYTQEQEDFRKEVRSWLEENCKVPPELGPIPEESDKMSREMWEWARGFQRKLGDKGWLYPLWPKEYGGGGLSTDHDAILQEELAKVERPITYGNTFIMPAVYVYGTEEQKQRFLRPILEGKAISWQLFTESEAGSDLASLRMRAVKDGDDFIITGEKIFVGGPHDADLLWTLAVTDPDAPRHQNIGAFVVPANLPGITIHTQNLIVAQGKRQISMDGVRVSRDHLVGEETQGWRAAQTSLEIEHGAAGAIRGRDDLLEDFIQYCKETKRGGQPLSKDFHNQMLLVDNYIESNIQRLIQLRNYWMFNNHQTATFHGSQNSYLRKLFNLSEAERILKILGPYGVIDDERWGPLKDRIEVHQRESLVGAHPGGTMEVQKLIMARRMGISRTRERAAPTHGG